MYIVINNIKINKEDILSLVQKKQKLTAIKEVRKQLGVGLKEAKEIVENLKKDPSYYDKGNHTKEMEIRNLVKYSYNSNGNQTIDNPKQTTSSLIQKTKSNTKTYIIVFLILCIVILIYLYVTK